MKEINLDSGASAVKKEDGYVHIQVVRDGVVLDLRLTDSDVDALDALAGDGDE